MKKITTPNGKTLFLNMSNLHSAEYYKAKSNKFWVALKFNNGLVENIGEFTTQEEAELFISNNV